MSERPAEPLTVDEICKQLDMGIAEALVYCYHEMMGGHALTERQGDQLRRVVNAIRGEPPADTLWSHHDAGELAEKMRELLDQGHGYVLRIASLNPDGTMRKYAGDAGNWLFKYHELVGIDMEGLIERAALKGDLDMLANRLIELAKPHVEYAAEHGDADGNVAPAAYWLRTYEHYTSSAPAVVMTRHTARVPVATTIEGPTSTDSIRYECPKCGHQTGWTVWTNGATFTCKKCNTELREP